MSDDSAFGLTFVIAGNNFSMSCSAYPNNSLTPSGITTSTPTASAIAPVIATAPGSPFSPTTLTSSLSGDGQSGGIVVVPSGTGVTDQATLGGTNAVGAGGTVTYTVFSFFLSTNFPFWGWKPAGTCQTVAVTNGVASPSPSLTLGPGVYVWEAFYSGDALNGASVGRWASQIEVVLAPPASSS